MIILIWTVGILGIVFAGWLSWLISSTQNEAISQCLDTKRLHNKLLVGDKDVHDLSNKELLLLRTSKFTTVGVGGMGPAYFPSYDVLTMVFDELAKRRKDKQ